MMVIMPALAETQKCHYPLVAALIGRLELPPAKGMADGIGAKGNMMHQKHSHQAGPKETCPPTNREWEHKRQDHPEHVGAVDQDDDRVLQEMATVDVGIGYAVPEDPADMCMKEPFNRAVWITLAVSPRVMFDVGGGPLKHRPFHCHGAEHE